MSRARAARWSEREACLTTRKKSWETLRNPSWSPAPRCVGAFVWALLMCIASAAGIARPPQRALKLQGFMNSVMHVQLENMNQSMFGDGTADAFCPAFFYWLGSKCAEVGLIAKLETARRAPPGTPGPAPADSSSVHHRTLDLTELAGKGEKQVKRA